MTPPVTVRVLTDPAPQVIPLVPTPPVPVALGTQGPAGPAGPAGATGPAGPQGGGTSWSDLPGKPAAFPPQAHTHTPQEVGTPDLILDGGYF